MFTKQLTLSITQMYLPLPIQHPVSQSVCCVQSDPPADQSYAPGLHSTKTVVLVQI